MAKKLEARPEGAEPEGSYRGLDVPRPGPVIVRPITPAVAVDVI